VSGRPSGPRLGRGLAALLGDAAPPGGRATASQALPLDLLEPGPFQPRRDMAPEAMEELVSSIRAQGVLQPILVRHHPEEPSRYEIIAGERRWRAAKQAGLHEIPVLLRELSNAEAMGAALVENLQRQDLNAIEEADGYKRLVDEFGLTQEQLGQAVGKSRSHVANALRLLSLPESVRRDLQQGRLTAGHARALLGHALPEVAAREVIARGLNVRQTEALVQRGATASRRTGASKVRDADTQAVERDLSEKLGLRVQLTRQGQGGAIRIEFKNFDQLDGLITLLTRD
jgi:ParB family transcriptional regulator, chromosome partitioning protein